MLEKGNDRFGAAFSAEVGSKRAIATVPTDTVTRVDNTVESSPINAPYEAGVWKIGERLVATNRPESEDNLTITSEEELRNLLEGTPYELFTDSGNSEDSFAQEIWRAFLIAMLVFLITEAILCLNAKPKKSTKAAA